MPDRVCVKHVMIDIETMGTDPTSAITQIGVARAEMYQEGGISGPMYYMGLKPVHTNVSLQSCLDYGLRVDADTMAWWLTREADARDAYVASQTQAVNLGQALASLSQYITRTAPDYIWAWPPQFDIATLSHAMTRTGVTIPWDHRSIRCARTLWDLRADRSRERRMPETHHQAGYDAQAQLRDIMDLMCEPGHELLCLPPKEKR